MKTKPKHDSRGVDGTNIIITPTSNFYGAGVAKVEVKIKKTLASGGKLFARIRLLTN